MTKPCCACEVELEDTHRGIFCFSCRKIMEKAYPEKEEPATWNSIEDLKPYSGQAVLIYQTYPKGIMFQAVARPLIRCFYVVAEFSDLNKEFVNRYNEPYKHVSHWISLPEKPTTKEDVNAKSD